MSTPGLTLLPSIIGAMNVVGLTLLLPSIDVTSIGSREARLRTAPCWNIQHRRIQLCFRARHRSVQPPNTRIMKKRVLSPRGRSAMRSRHAGSDVDRPLDLD
jgi:hypothetical protein